MAKKILIADDEENIRELVRVALEDEGLDIHEAVDGDDALAKAREIRPDLMVLDVMMPGKVGYEVCDELKKDPATKGIFVIFLSARGTSLAEITSKQKGGDDFMVKPFDPMELRNKVLKALNIEP